MVGVETSSGVIKTKCVVNAAGVWSRNICNMLKLDIPLSPMKHAYVITESILEVRDTPNIRDHDYSVYLRIQGDAVYLGGYEPNPELLKEVSCECTRRCLREFCSSRLRSPTTSSLGCTTWTTPFSTST